MINWKHWPLSRLLVAVLGAGFLGLMNDIRVEHVEAVHENRLAWIPIVYSALMALACFGTVFLWKRATRLVLLVFFLAAFVVGGLGVWFHNDGNLLHVARVNLRAWQDPKMTHPAGPPATAPMAFAGFGLIGALACFERFDSGRRKEADTPSGTA